MASKATPISQLQSAQSQFTNTNDAVMIFYKRLNLPIINLTTMIWSPNRLNIKWTPTNSIILNMQQQPVQQQPPTTNSLI